MEVSPFSAVVRRRGRWDLERVVVFFVLGLFLIGCTVLLLADPFRKDGDSEEGGGANGVWVSLGQESLFLSGKEARSRLKRYYHDYAEKTIGSQGSGPLTDREARRDLNIFWNRFTASSHLLRVSKPLSSGTALPSAIEEQVKRTEKKTAKRTGSFAKELSQNVGGQHRREDVNDEYDGSRLGQEEAHDHIDSGGQKGVKDSQSGDSNEWNQRNATMRGTASRKASAVSINSSPALFAARAPRGQHRHWVDSLLRVAPPNDESSRSGGRWAGNRVERARSKKSAGPEYAMGGGDELRKSTGREGAEDGFHGGGSHGGGTASSFREGGLVDRGDDISLESSMREAWREGVREGNMEGEKREREEERGKRMEVRDSTKEEATRREMRERNGGRAWGLTSVGESREIRERERERGALHMVARREGVENRERDHEGTDPWHHEGDDGGQGQRRDDHSRRPSRPHDDGLDGGSEGKREGGEHRQGSHGDLLHRYQSSRGSESHQSVRGAPSSVASDQYMRSAQMESPGYASGQLTHGGMSGGNSMWSSDVRHPSSEMSGNSLKNTHERHSLRERSRENQAGVTYEERPSHAPQGMKDVLQRNEMGADERTSRRFLPSSGTGWARTLANHQGAVQREGVSQHQNLGGLALGRDRGHVLGSEPQNFGVEMQRVDGTRAETEAEWQGEGRRTDQKPNLSGRQSEMGSQGGLLLRADHDHDGGEGQLRADHDGDEGQLRADHDGDEGQLRADQNGGEGKMVLQNSATTNNIFPDTREAASGGGLTTNHFLSSNESPRRADETEFRATSGLQHFGTSNGAPRSVDESGIRGGSGLQHFGTAEDAPRGVDESGIRGGSGLQHFGTAEDAPRGVDESGIRGGSGLQHFGTTSDVSRNVEQTGGAKVSDLQHFAYPNDSSSRANQRWVEGGSELQHQASSLILPPVRGLDSWARGNVNAHFVSGQGTARHLPHLKQLKSWADNVGEHVSSPGVGSLLGDKVGGDFGTSGDGHKPWAEIVGGSGSVGSSDSKIRGNFVGGDPRSVSRSLAQSSSVTATLLMKEARKVELRMEKDEGALHRAEGRVAQAREAGEATQ